jgi:hypothetical protein
VEPAVALVGSMQDAAGITRSEDEPVWSVPLPLSNRAAELVYGFCWFWEGFSLYICFLFNCSIKINIFT